MELRNVMTFLKVAETRNFTKAAELLGYVQSTVTVQIRQLETEIGAPLFDRIGKTVSLTSVGLEFMTYANQLIKVAEESKMIGKIPREYSGQLRIGVLESMFAWLLDDLLLKYHQEYPGIAVETKTASGSDLFKMLKQNQLDIIFVLDKKMDRKDCVRFFARPVRIIFATHPHNALAAQDRVTLGDVVKHPLILTEKGSIYRQALEDLAAGKNMTIAPFWEIDNTAAIVKLLQSGLGVSFLPEYAVSGSLARQELARIEVRGCSVQFWSQAFYSSNKWVSPAMSGFIRILQQSCGVGD